MLDFLDLDLDYFFDFDIDNYRLKLFLVSFVKNPDGEVDLDLEVFLKFLFKVFESF